MADAAPIYLALMWHMHQPYYKDIRTGKYIMPWVRLHATKDYLDMVRLLEEFPDIRSNFNIVPSLLEQLDDYVNHGATDLVWDMTVRPANDLNDGEKKFILQKFFHANHDTMVRPYARYRELYDKRGWAKSEAELVRAVQYFHEQDFRDLQVWYNLVWIDPYFRKSDPQLMRLMEKGGGFSEEDKQVVLEKSARLMSQIVPAYTDAASRGQIEISCTPFYHPILPLIVDTNLGRVARPEISLPRHRFAHPDDAAAQVKAGIAFHEKAFGSRPAGMWPAEGSVAPEILPLVCGEGIQWIATDEEILSHSLNEPVRRDISGVVNNPDTLYHPYHVEHEGAKASIIFRDHFLSDLIGFQYAGWNAEDASADLVSRIDAVARLPLSDPDSPRVVSIILDGENCWEHYDDDGIPFLRSLYTRLSESKTICTTRVCDFLEQYPPKLTLPKLFAGSWINHDFQIWLGHKEDNQSWDYLYEVRQAVANHIEQHRDELTAEQIETAWKEIYIAEGSDWNWWYGDDHSSGIDEEFDQLYRDHLMSACQSIGLTPPSFLYIPIKTRGSALLATEPKAFLHPVIDGRNSTYYEWFAAGKYDPTTGGASMHQSQFLIRRLYYGFDHRNLFFRIDPDRMVLAEQRDQSLSLNIYVINRGTWRLCIELSDGRPGANPGGLKARATLAHETNSQYDEICVLSSVAVDHIVESSVPFELLELKSGEEVHFYVTIEVEGRELERCPVRAPIPIKMPEANFESRMWMV